MMNLSFSGSVEKGEGLARHLGCPTANLALREGGIIPGLGVYVGIATHDGAHYPSVICINDGRQGLVLKLEVHLLDKCLDLLGQHLHVRIFEKMRDLVAWRGEEQMKTLIANDIEQARHWWQEHQALMETYGLQ